MEFQYSAKATSGQAAIGAIDAASIGEARLRLREQGLFILSLAAQSQKAAAAPNRSSRQSFYRSRVRKSDLLMLTSQLSIMCQAGVDLAEALKNVAEQCRHPMLKQTLDAVYADVSGGKPVSIALKQHAHIFGEAYVAGIAAAEASGTMTEVLGRLADLLRNEIRMQSTLVSALSYPLVLSGVALIVVMALIFFVLPQFSDVFTDLGAPPPPTTQVLMDVANTIRDNVLMIVAVAVAAGMGAWRFCFTDRAKRWFDGFSLQCPVVRDATQPLLIGRVLRLIGTMLESGLPLLEAIQLCRSSVRNQKYRDLFQAIEEDVMNGNGIAKALASVNFVPLGAVQMVSTAEKTGKLGPVMQAVGAYYEDEGERHIRQLAKLLEPAIIVCMGVVVAFVVLSVMLPLLDVSTMSH